MCIIFSGFDTPDKNTAKQLCWWQVFGFRVDYSSQPQLCATANSCRWWWFALQCAAPSYLRPTFSCIGSCIRRNILRAWPNRGRLADHRSRIPQSKQLFSNISPARVIMVGPKRASHDVWSGVGSKFLSSDAVNGSEREFHKTAECPPREAPFF